MRAPLVSFPSSHHPIISSSHHLPLLRVLCTTILKILCFLRRISRCSGPSRPSGLSGPSGLAAPSLEPNAQRRIWLRPWPRCALRTFVAFFIACARRNAKGKLRGRRIVVGPFTFSYVAHVEIFHHAGEIPLLLSRRGGIFFGKGMIQDRLVVPGGGVRRTQELVSAAGRKGRPTAHDSRRFS